MRLALLSDVHGNLQALRTVLERLDGEGVDRIVCLGDVVGYGGDPEACLEIVRARADVCVLGNHDAAAAWPWARSSFHSYARAAIEKHAEWLGAEALEYLGMLPPEVRLGNGGPGAAFLKHGCPGEEVPFTYLVTAAQADLAFEGFSERFGAVGHTHVPALYERDGSAGVTRERPLGPRRLSLEDAPAGRRNLTVPADRRAILNPGSVGQPRDGDPRAACMILDLASGDVRYLRLSYDVAGAQDAIRRRRLPEALAWRLAHGR